MAHKFLNLAKIMMRGALGLILIMGNAPTAKAEKLYSGSKHSIDVYVYKGCNDEVTQILDKNPDVKAKSLIGKLQDKAAQEFRRAIKRLGGEGGGSSSDEFFELKYFLMRKANCSYHEVLFFFKNPSVEDAQGNPDIQKMKSYNVQGGDVILAYKTGVFQNRQPVICKVLPGQNIVFRTIKSKIPGDGGLMCDYNYIVSSSR